MPPGSPDRLIPRRKIKHANIIGIVALGNLFVCSQYSLVRKFVVAKVNKDCHICCVESQ